MPSFGAILSLPRTGLLAIALLACHSLPAPAQVKVEGSADAVRIEATNAPLRDVLGALQARFGLRYRSNDALDAERTARLRAPLRAVIARMLEGYDFVITVTPAGMDVLILQQNAAANVSASRISPAQAPVPTAPAAPPGQASYRERD
jgi:hypothetical protein